MIRFTRRRVRRLSVIAGVCALMAGFYFVVDPMSAWWAPKCIFRMLTGLECPGCGSQRVAHALLHGDLKGAWVANPLVVVLLPMIAGWVWVDSDPDLHPHATRLLNSPGFIVLLLVVIIGWGVLRNII
ncbi:MAG: DUF2752 domain-containing protein [Muribaculaceae bacterium]|nr:DUF2752 domain-containing protein [Muribaculaceae bacterium]